ncbi:STAS domain-containing protein [Streptomyces sp. NPDC053429]|uniref:STAS domain-containing protein n=1 Tax=unclassified Streptomyces TaxID=2593676 RepID=UPI00340A3B38
MTDSLTLTTTHTDDFLTVVRVCGAIDVATAPALRSEAVALITSGQSHLILDLAQVSFCDSSGLNVLIGIMRCAHTADGSLTLAAIPERLARMLDLTGVSTFLPAYPSADAALRARRDGLTAGAAADPAPGGRVPPSPV